MISNANVLACAGAAACRLALTLAATGPVLAQDYPSRPVRIISQAGVGSAPDVMARIVADQLGKAWGQQAIIINRPGASGANAAQMAASADPDGYTLFLANSSTFTIMPETQTKLPFDVQRDFVPAGFVAEQPMLIAVNAALPVNSLAELIALAKERPGQLLYAGNAGGSTPNMTGEFFRERADIDITYVSYPGAAAGLTDVIAGRVQIIIEGLPALFGAVEAHSIRPLAVLAACPTFLTCRSRATHCPALLRPGGRP
jgi:tripartite-type tricarboxylate transporter receptor subunit TctC